MFTATLSANAQNALAILGKSHSLPPSTYLAGGSALALHYGHRISVDFDFFTPQAFEVDSIIKSVSKLGNFELKEKHTHTILGIFNEVKFSLFLYEYPLLEKTTPFVGTELSSPDDIAAMKIATVMNRGTKKDFVDLFFLAKNGISLDDALVFYDRKFQALANNIYSIILGLNYMEEVEKTEMPEMLISIQWEQVKEFFLKETKRLAEKYL